MTKEQLEAYSKSLDIIAKSDGKIRLIKITQIVTESQNCINLIVQKRINNLMKRSVYE